MQINSLEMLNVCTPVKSLTLSLSIVVITEDRPSNPIPFFFPKVNLGKI